MTEMTTGNARRREQDARLNDLIQWIAGLSEPIRYDIDSIRPASSDASFRRYFRLDTLTPGNRTATCATKESSAARPTTVIAMDAPPPQENCASFLHAAQVFAQNGVNTPVILASNIERGFLLLSDFGPTTLLDELRRTPDTGERRYRQAGRELTQLQIGSKPSVFANYDREILLRELKLYDHWYLPRHKDIELSVNDQQVLDEAYQLIIDNNLSQPRVYVHRDYHARNLMVTGEDCPLGVLDFQDALYGPITYDLVSLLRDAYIQWPEEQVLDWAIRYWETARQSGLPVNSDFGDFYRDFEWMGLQRHLKVLGIFARLNYRDGKSNYLNDMPVVLDYVLKTTRRYVQFKRLTRLIERTEQLL